MMDEYENSRERDIDEILELIGNIWRENPDLRLCQLIANCFHKGEDIYYKYDADLVDALLERYQY